MNEYFFIFSRFVWRELFVYYHDCANPDKNEGFQPTFQTRWHTEIFVIRKHPNSSFHIISACIENLPGFSQLNVRYYLPLVSPAFNSILSVCCHDFFLQGRKVHIAICCLPQMGRRFNIFYIKKITSIFWYYKFVFWYQEFFFHIRNSNWFFNIKIYIFWYHNYK